MEQSHKFKTGWIPGVLFQPTKTFTQNIAQPKFTWLAPLLILTVTGLLVVLASGWLQGRISGEMPLPPDYEYMSAEQQAQYAQAYQLRQGPVFQYVFPALTSLAKVWIGWLLVGGIIHLVLTMLGGRGSARTALNLVAWSGLPFAIRDVIRLFYLLIAKKLIASPGLSGMLDASQGGFTLFMVSFLTLVDLYLVWHILLLIAGVRLSSGLAVGKATISVILTMLVVIALQALLSFGIASLSNLSVVRMFF